MANPESGTAIVSFCGGFTRFLFIIPFSFSLLTTSLFNVFAVLERNLFQEDLKGVSLDKYYSESI